MRELLFQLVNHPIRDSTTVPSFSCQFQVYTWIVLGCDGVTVRKERQTGYTMPATLRSCLIPLLGVRVGVGVGVARRSASNSSRSGDSSDLELARQWLRSLTIHSIPRHLGQVSFSRSSGPGGQNVNKSVSTRKLFPFLFLSVSS